MSLAKIKKDTPRKAQVQYNRKQKLISGEVYHESMTKTINVERQMIRWIHNDMRPHKIPACGKQQKTAP